MALDYDRLRGGKTPGPTFGQKLSDVSHKVKQIWDVGSGIYHAAKLAAPIISALL